MGNVILSGGVEGSMNKKCPIIIQESFSPHLKKIQQGEVLRLPLFHRGAQVQFKGPGFLTLLM